MESKWIVAICPSCKKAVDICKDDPNLEGSTAYAKAFMKDLVERGCLIELRNSGQFPIEISPCMCEIEKVSFDGVKASLLSLIDEAGKMHSDFLDDEVHDVASRIASAVNNEGVAAQIDYIGTNSKRDEAIERIIGALSIFSNQEPEEGP